MCVLSTSASSVSDIHVHRYELKVPSTEGMPHIYSTKQKPGLVKMRRKNHVEKNVAGHWWCKPLIPTLERHRQEDL